VTFTADVRHLRTAPQSASAAHAKPRVSTLPPLDEDAAADVVPVAVVVPAAIVVPVAAVDDPVPPLPLEVESPDVDPVVVPPSLQPAYAATATPRHINAIFKLRSRILGLLLHALPARRMRGAR